MTSQLDPSTLAPLAARTYAILGMGTSGTAVATALTRCGAAFTCWDGKEHDDVEGHHVTAMSEPSELAQAVIGAAPDVVVISPGFPATGPVWQALNETEIEVISEIELAWRIADARGVQPQWLCITGTNGKTTTTTMAAAMVAASGRSVAAVGNVGTPPVLKVLEDTVPEVFVAELSSFQLHATTSLEPTSAVILNIADDHLDWHGSLEEYAAAKATIYRNVTTACIYPVGSSEIRALLPAEPRHPDVRYVGYGVETSASGCIGFVGCENHEGDREFLVIDRAFVHDPLHGVAELFTYDDLIHLAPAGLPLHIVTNAMAAAALARSIGTPPEAIAQALRDFDAGHHRIERVPTTDGRIWINDSKATNAHAAAASLRAQGEGSVVWIVGGLAKGATFGDLVETVKDHLAGVVVIGVDQQPWIDALEQVTVPVVYIDTASSAPMADAVQAAAALAPEGAVVLMAPACASMDQFTSYAHRGDAFVAAVKEYIQ